MTQRAPLRIQHKEIMLLKMIQEVNVLMKTLSRKEFDLFGNPYIPKRDAEVPEGGEGIHSTWKNEIE